MRSDGLAAIDSEQIRVLRNGLRIMALRALGDVDSADDVVQEALLRALNSVTPEIACDATRLGAFVGGIARHVIADVHRRAARIRLVSGDAHVPDPAHDALSVILRNEEAARVRHAIGRLPAGDQMVVRASFYESLTPMEIAERLNEPVERVRKRKSRALMRLRAALQGARGHESAPDPNNSERDEMPVVARGGA